MSTSSEGNGFMDDKINSMDQRIYQSPVVKQLRKELEKSAQAGLDLLSENEKLNEKINQYSQMYNKLLEDYSLERQRYLHKKNKIIEEYEEKLFDLQNQLDSNKTLTTSMVIQSRPYEKLLTQYENLCVTVDELKKELIKSNADNDINNHYHNNIIHNNSNIPLRFDYPLMDSTNFIQNTSHFETEYYTLIDRLIRNNDILQEEIKILQHKYEIEISTLKITNSNLQNNNFKLQNQLDEIQQELTHEQTVCNRAIDTCKNLSIQCMNTTNELSYLKNYIRKSNTTKIPE